MKGMLCVCGIPHPVFIIVCGICAPEKKMNTKDKLNVENVLYSKLFLLLLTGAGVAFMVCKCIFSQIWQDELYTLGVISYNYKEMLEAIARDVHPPLYYLILKVIMDFTKMIFRDVDIVMLARVISMMPFIILMLINATLIRKRFGPKVAFVFGFLITFMPKFMLFNITIRMYSLGMICVTLTYLLFYLIVFEGKNLYVPFSLCALAAMYTHYFAAVSVAVLMLHMFVYLCIKRRSVVRLCVSAVAIAICYMPWFLIALGQMSKVFEDYWIPPLSLRTFLGVASFVVCPPVNNDYLDGVICIAVVVLYLYGWIRLWNKNKGLFAFSVTGFNMVALTALFGIAISYIYRPIFIARYLTPSLGAFWFSYAVWFKEADDKDKVMIRISLIILAILGMISTVIFEQRSLVVLMS